jgi:hypothetical protein
MICDACGREHVIEGEILIDGTRVPEQWFECLVETMCSHGKLRTVEPEGDLVEPDVELGGEA